MFLKFLGEKQPSINEQKGKSARPVKIQNGDRDRFPERSRLFCFWTLIECILLTSKAEIDFIKYIHELIK